jgi:hypothetical protein
MQNKTAMHARLLYNQDTAHSRQDKQHLNRVNCDKVSIVDLEC